VITRVIGDTSAIVAVLRSNETHHYWATKTLREIPKPIVTCEAVIAECCFLLSASRTGQKAVLDRLTEGIIEIGFRLSDEIDHVSRLISKYSDVPMSLADACLVRMSESIADSAIFTLDQDFLVYRKHQRQRIPLIMPE
jgi:uncharacterized protein